MTAVGGWAIGCVVFAIVLGGWLSGADVFESFLKGAAGGIETAVRILPALVALITSVGVFRASGALDLLTHALSPAARAFGLPEEIIPLALLRPISGSGAMVIFDDLLRTHGPDSLVGRVASVLQGSTETTFYTIAVYFGATSIRRTRHALPSALTGDFAGFIMSAVTVRLFFGG